jgi:spermidine/putrescine transport system ATP-binding protein
VSESSVRLSGVEKRFGELVAVRSLDLDIAAGEFFSIIGPSGCGKTTTLRMIAGFERPTRGTVEIAGREVTGLPPYRRPVNTVFQSYALFPHLDVFENVAFGLREAHVPRAELRRRVAAAISLARLDGRERARPNQLSGGQQQRVALARALVNRPEVLLLDEPLGALDLKLRKEMQAQLKDLQREVGITFVYVTHDQEEAFSMSDRVAVMEHGLLEQIGRPEDVYRRPMTPFVASFVGLANQLAGRIAGPAPGESYQVDLDHLGRRLAHGPPGLAAGIPVSVVVRPEDLSLTPAADSQAGPAAATVVDVAFLGAHRTVRLDAGALGQLVAIGQGQSAIAPDDKVVLSWADDDAWTVPAAAEDEAAEGGAAEGGAAEGEVR